MPTCTSCSTTSLETAEDIPTCTKDIDTCAPCAKLKDLRKEIAAAKAHLAELLGRIPPLRYAMNHAHDPLENRLPPEIISRIFVFYASYFDFYSMEHDVLLPRPDNLPVTLGAVCKRWREIAWATPSLWTTVDVHLDPRSMTQERSQLLKEWLERSRSLPLTLVIRSESSLSTCVGTPGGLNILSIVDSINSHSSRWSSLAIHAPSSVASRLHLKITIRPNAADAADNSMSSSMTDILPSPEQVSLRGLRFRTVRLDWSNVIHVELSDLFVDECLCLLCEATKPVSCNLRITQGSDGHIVPQHEILHIKIGSLEIAFSDAELLGSFFSRINLPALNYLECDASDFGHGDQDTINAIEAFLSRSVCPLQHLQLCELRAPNADIIQLLKLLSKLESLYLFNTAVTDELLDFMVETNTTPEEDNHFLPCLKSFCFGGPQTFSWTSIRRLVPVLSSDVSEDGQKMRPWKELEVGVRVDDPETTFIDEDTISRIDTLGKGRLTVVDIRTGDDFVTISRKYHNRRSKKRHAAA
ncbi:unnamed protein product [Cyclocybe aegerita]|uniref:F-box domain-containing protein n=1 Tax=Cyclocybe aegerita TaxID=1973307 RepID=A0A8S0VRW9_CYCAE|nr:unnamed protein product [Cyclocybe aegerita]